jgi:replicative DNA helicase
MTLEDSNFVKNKSLNFCRQQVLKKAIKQAEEIMTNGNFEQYNDIESIMQKALQVGANTDDMEDIFSNIRETLESDNRVPLPTGITGIDNLLKGGLAKGELGIVLAPTGVGKSTILTKFANSAYNTGSNVLHVFFEDNKKDIRRKHYTIWTQYSPDEQYEHKEEVISIVEGIEKNKKNFMKLLKLPAFGVSIADIKSKIRKLRSEGHNIDLLVLDYIDCITSEGTINGEEWKGQGNIMRSLESMTDEFNIAIWTATQGNRDSISSEVVTTDQMGGSIQKAQIGHVVLSIGKTLEQKEHNLATVTLLKSRIGKDGIVFQNCKFDNEYLDIDTDTQNTLLGHEEEKAEKKRQRIAEVYNNEKNKEKSKIEKEIENITESIYNNVVHKFENKEPEITDVSPNGDGIPPINDPPIEIKPVAEVKPTMEIKIVSNNVIKPADSNTKTITQLMDNEKIRTNRVKELRKLEKMKQLELNSS